MIIVWGSIEIPSEHKEEALSLSLEHVARSRGEPGCLTHSVQIDVENSNRLVFYEEWEDMPALQAHFQVAGSLRFVESVGQMALAPPVMKIFEASQIR